MLLLTVAEEFPHRFILLRINLKIDYYKKSEALNFAFFIFVIYIITISLENSETVGTENFSLTIVS